jgi:hypothetical protein
MTDKRLLLVLAPFALLAACDKAPEGEDGRSASGEVLEGTVSDAMLPLDRVRSEPPLEDPDAFAEVQEEAAEEAAEVAEGEASAERDAEGGEAEEEAPAVDENAAEPE